MAKAKQFVVTRATNWEDTNWTNGEPAHYGDPAQPVSKEKAEKALKKAQRQFPDETYKLREVKR